MTESERIRELRRALSFTQREFGERIGLSDAAISQFEKGKIEMANQTRLSICREFNVNEDWLRTGEGEMFVHLNRSEEIAGFLGDVMRENQGFRVRLISILSRLSSAEWELLESMAKKLMEEEEEEKSGP